VALFGHGSAKAFAGGFAVCLLGYLSLIYLVLDHENGGMGRVVTTRALKLLHTAVATEVRSTPPPTSFFGGRMVTYQPDHDQFMQVGQQLWALLIGLMGGWLASCLSKHLPDDRSGSAT